LGGRKEEEDEDDNKKLFQWKSIGLNDRRERFECKAAGAEKPECTFGT
jgi:hypothetical protein